MSLEITVRGAAEERFPPERATLRMHAAVDGPERSAVLAAAVRVQDPLLHQLGELVALSAVTTWSSSQVRVLAQRPWEDGRPAGELLHTARVGVTAEFVDFERLSGFVDHWAAKDGVEVEGITWDVTAKSRRLHEAEVRRSAVDDAVSKAQAYADAVRRGRVVALELADPGMLSGRSGEGAPGPLTLAARSVDAGPSLELVPEDIVVSVQVDARFSAD